MTPSMFEQAGVAAAEAGLINVECREGYGEALPVYDGWTDVVISNGVLNLMLDKRTALREMARVLKPEYGRYQLPSQKGEVEERRQIENGRSENVCSWSSRRVGRLSNLVIVGQASTRTSLASW